MNEIEFKRHLRDLANGHHHPEEHDWDAQPGAPKKTPATTAGTKARKSRNSADRKTPKSR
jgi:hypothetical protein